MEPKYKDMKIYLVELSSAKCEALEKYFEGAEDVEVCNTEFGDFCDSHDFDCIVSPANAFGFMDGGYDEAISRYFGNGLQKKVREKIIAEYCGQQPLATALIVEIGPGMSLMHVPTMQMPERIKDPFIVYQCMRVTLMEAKKQGFKNIVIPMFGGATGRLPADLVARLMWLGYKHVKEPLTEINWLNARRVADECLAAVNESEF